MDGENRETLGERLVGRLMNRNRRRPRLGFSPDFYARFGMDDPWSFQETVESEPQSDGFVYLSASPYYAMLRRLAASRRRREKRQAAFTERRAGSRMRAAKRAWPGESAAVAAISKMARFGADEFVLPPPIPTAAPAEAAEATPASAPRRRVKAPAKRVRGAAAWLSQASRVDRPATERASTSSPVTRAAAAEHAGARLARAASASSPLLRALEEAAPVGAVRHRATLARVVEVLETLPDAERVVQVRRLARQLGVRAAHTEVVVEDDAPQAAPARAASVAARRMAPARTAGLRPILGSSPALALASAPEVDRAATGTLATAQRTEDGRKLADLPRRARATSRAAARANPPAGTSALPSPVGHARTHASAALAASPVARVLAAASAASDGGGSSRPSPGIRRVTRIATEGTLPRPNLQAPREEATATAAAAPRAVAAPSPSRASRGVAPSSRSTRAIDVAQWNDEAPVAARVPATARALARAIVPLADDVVPAPRVARSQVSRTSAMRSPEGRFVSFAQAVEPAEVAAVTSPRATPAPAGERPSRGPARASAPLTVRLAAAADRSAPAPRPAPAYAVTETERSAPVLHAAARADAPSAATSVVPRAPRAAARTVLAAPLALPDSPAAAADPVAPRAAPARARRVAAQVLASSAPVQTTRGTFVAARVVRAAAAAAATPARAGVRAARPVAAAPSTRAAPGAPPSREATSWVATPAARRPSLVWAAAREPAAEEAESALVPAANPGSRRPAPLRETRETRETRDILVPGLAARALPPEALPATRARLERGEVARPADPTARRPVGPATVLAGLPTSPMATASPTTAGPTRAETSRAESTRGEPTRAAHPRRRAAAEAPVASVAAWRRLIASPLASLTGARALADSAPVAPSASPVRATTRHLATGPMAFATPATELLRALADVAPSAEPSSRAAGRASGHGTGSPARATGPSSPVTPTSSIVQGARAARAFTGARTWRTPASLIAATSPVQTPAGVWVGARSVRGMPGLTIVANRAGGLVALPEAGAPAGTPGVAPIGAPVGAPRTMRATAPTVRYVQSAPAASDETATLAPAAVDTTRALTRALARVRVGDATAFRGAYAPPDAPAAKAPARRTLRIEEPTLASATPETTGAEGTLARPADRATAPTRAEAVRRRPRVVPVTAAETLARPEQGAIAGDAAAGRTVAGRTAAGQADADHTDAGTFPGGAAAARRKPLERRLADVADGRAPSAGAPGWVSRAAGEPPRSVSGLFTALARATTTEQIVRVIMARVEGRAVEPAIPLDAPAAQVIQQIQQEARAAVTEDATFPEPVRDSRLPPPAAETLQGGSRYVQPVASSARAVRGSTRPIAATARRVGASSGDDRIMRLVKKLQGLIHLAEAEHRLAEAQRRVRMAEDSPGAKAEASGPVGATQSNGKDVEQQDIEALGREVLEVVTKELEIRRQRRMEDHDESVWW